ncbi:MAG: hypothetical protein AVDCRST_MAG35-25, partial [uncultured Quadrisphaera sp.]
AARARPLHPARRPVLRAAARLRAPGPAEHGAQPRRLLAAADRPAGAWCATERRGAAVVLRRPGGALPDPLRLPAQPARPVQAVRPPAGLRRGLRRRARRLRLLGPLRPRRHLRARPRPPAPGGVRRRQGALRRELRPVPEHPGGCWVVPARGRADQLPRRPEHAPGPALRRVGRHLPPARRPRRPLVAGGGGLRPLLRPLPHPCRAPAGQGPAPVRLGGRRGRRAPGGRRGGRAPHGPAGAPAEAPDARPVAGGRARRPLLDRARLLHRPAPGLPVGGARRAPADRARPGAAVRAPRPPPPGAPGGAEGWSVAL